MNWILIVVTLAYGPKPIVFTADFSSEKTCMAVRAEVRGSFQRSNKENLLLTANCFPK